MLLNHRVDASKFLSDESTSLRCCMLIFSLLRRQGVRAFPDLPRRPHPPTGTGPPARLYFPADSNAARGITNTDDTSGIAPAPVRKVPGEMVFLRHLLAVPFESAPFQCHPAGIPGFR